VVQKHRGYYLCGGGMEVYCHRLPLSIPVCESCNRPLLVPIRGIQRMEPNIIWGICPEWNDTSYPCHQMNCPTCNPPEKAYVVWVGESFYETPESYLDEVRRMGISRKIPFVPEDLNVGDWVFLGFRKLIPTGSITGSMKRSNCLESSMRSVSRASRNCSPMHNRKISTT